MALLTTFRRLFVKNEENDAFLQKRHFQILRNLIYSVKISFPEPIIPFAVVILYI